MRRIELNQCRLDLELAVSDQSALLIAKERPEKVEGNNKEPLVTRPVTEHSVTYLPGSSLKGVFRSRAEYIANTICQSGPGSCHLFAPSIARHGRTATDSAPFVRMSCGERFNLLQSVEDQTVTTMELIRNACPICGLFGHTLFEGHIRFTDFKKTGEEIKLEQPHIAIDRILSHVAQLEGKAGQNFTNEYVRAAIYKGHIVITNFTYWHLGLLGFLLRDIEDGLLTLGAKGTTGNGRLKVNAISATFRVTGRMHPGNGKLPDVQLLAPTLAEQYGFPQSVREREIADLDWMEQPFSYEARLGSKESLEPVWQATRGDAASVLSAFSFADTMKASFLLDLAKENDLFQETA